MRIRAPLVSSLRDFCLKCAGHLSDGCSSGVKFKLPAMVAFAGWSLTRGGLYSVDCPSEKKRSENLGDR